MENTDIRIQLKKTGVRQWQVAETLGIGESTLCRKMRKELPEEEKEIILNAIEKLSKEAV